MQLVYIYIHLFVLGRAVEDYFERSVGNVANHLI